VNHFWPKRNDPKGFSIEKLAKGYRDKLSKKKISNTNDLSSGLANVVKFAENEHHNLSEIPENASHWANRYFEEYRISA
tara:strand:+ start:931 stop:1167 length:237 start_codon:yes stop_codon:yes gene_type:complete